VFLAMFTAQMNERAEGRVVIPDADSQVLGQMLEWMYTGKTGDLADPVVDRGLLFVADKYQLDEFKVFIHLLIPIKRNMQKIYTKN
jgi:hypothetical protein